MPRKENSVAALFTVLPVLSPEESRKRFGVDRPNAGDYAREHYHKVPCGSIRVCNTSIWDGYCNAAFDLPEKCVACEMEEDE